MTANSPPMAAVPIPSQIGLPVATVRPTPRRARISPSRAPVSSSRTTGNSGLREKRMNCHQLPLPLSGRDSTIAVRKLYDSKQIATNRITTATIGEVSGVGWVILW